MDDEKFEMWAIVELFGRQIIAGKVSEQEVAGQGMIRIDVPSTPEQFGYTKFFGVNAIYCITPTDQATAKTAVERLRCKPVELWKLNLPQLPGPEDDEEEGSPW